MALRDTPLEESFSLPSPIDGGAGENHVRAETAASAGGVRARVVPPCSSILLLDEPTAACDSLSCAAVERLLIETGAACVVVTHDERQAERLANTRIILA